MFVKVEMCMQSYITNQYIWASIFPLTMTDDFKKYIFWIFIASTYTPQKGLSGTFFGVSSQTEQGVGGLYFKILRICNL